MLTLSIRHALGGCLLTFAGLAPFAERAVADTVAPGGCPLFHCTVEATGVMRTATIDQVLTVKRTDSLGTHVGQGCSGNGANLICLFTADTVSGTGKGTLKALDAATLQPVWGSADAPNAVDLDGDTAAIGQAPLIFANGDIAAGDATVHVRYNAAGAVINQLALGGKGSNAGVTPVSDTHGIVSQADGVLTLIDLSTWQRVATLTLRDPTNNAAVALVSPSSANGNVLYAVAYGSRSKRGILYAVVFDAASQSLKLRASFVFSGRSAASPVVVTPSVSGLAKNLILLHVPGLTTDATPQNRLLGLTDTGSGFTTSWAIAMARPVQFSPTVDEATGSVFFAYRDGTQLFQHGLAAGEARQVFDIPAIGGFLPSAFTLNGHLVASQAGGRFTLFLSGAVKGSRGQNGQYVMGFAPVIQPASLRWVAKIASKADSYTAAWTTVPASRPDVACLVVVSVDAGLTRLCDF